MLLQLLSSLRLLSIGDYRRSLFIGALGGAARWLEFVAFAIYAFQLTGSAQFVAMLGLLRMLPYALAGIVTGALADVMDRRAMMIAESVAMTAIAAASAFAGVLMPGGLPALWIGGVTLASGLFWTLDMPVRRRLMADSAPREDIAAALGLDNALMYLMRMLGPVAGGILFQVFGIEGVFVLATAIYAGCALLAVSIDRAAPRQEAAVMTPLWRRLLPPWSLLLDRRFMVVMGITAVFNLWCFPFISMVPVIAQKDFALSPALVGALAALEGAGGTLGALILSGLARERTLFRIYFVGVSLFLVLMALLSLHLSVVNAIVVLPLIGVAFAAFSATQYALVHISVPADMRGRAAGILAIFIGTAMIGFYIAGELFERFGSVPAMQIMAAAGLAMMAVLGLVWTTAPPVAKDHRRAE